MKKQISIALFCGFAMLCGAETGPKFLESAKRESGAVRYVAGAEEKAPAGKTEPTLTDYKKLVDDINPDGA